MTVKFPGVGSLAFDPQSRDEVEFIVREIVYDGAYLGAPIRLDPGAVVLDVGANIGVFALFVHEKLDGDCTLFAFEPGPRTFSFLSENVKGKAQVFQVALGAAPGRALLTTYAGLPANATLKPKEKAAELAAFKDRSLAEVDPLLRPFVEPRFDALFASEEMEVEVQDLSGVVRREGIERIDLLKIDVEGAEAEVLDGIDDATWPWIRQVALETTGAERARQLSARLRGRGFEEVRAFRPRFAERMGLDNHEVLAVR